MHPAPPIVPGHGTTDPARPTEAVPATSPEAVRG
jgi:hypothetical protein